MQSIRGIVNFLQTAESGSFTAASKILGISAVAVGKNVAALEKDLGVRLFQRTTRQLELTDEGRLLVEQSKLPLRDLDLAYKSIKQRAQSPTGLVRSSYYLCAAIWKGNIASFAAATDIFISKNSSGTDLRQQSCRHGCRRI
jgi:DNA-binding transcriptional LysR family regulator